MFKKIFSVLLMFGIMNFSFLPVFSQEQSESYTTGSVIKAEFKTDLNVNKASKGQVVQFISTEDYKTEGYIIPKGTIFKGEIKHMKKGRFGYRRAKAVVVINEMILPDGKTFTVKAFTKRHVLKGSAIKNVGKGVITSPVAVVTCAVGCVVIIVEAVSIVGIVAIGPTSYLFGETMGKLTHGVNYKKHTGDKIKLKIKSCDL